MKHLEADGIEYDILERAIKAVQHVPGLFLEIGTRRGGSLQIAIDAALKTGQQRTFISVDPYGNIPYNDGRNVTRYDYTNRMRFEAMAQLFSYVQDKPVNVIHFTLEDTEFFSRFADGVPVYDQEKKIFSQYAFAFLDGPHDLESIMEEIGFLSPRMHPGAQIVVDNIEYFDVAAMVERCSLFSFEEVERNNQKIRLCKH